MYTQKLLDDINNELISLQGAGKYKTERVLTSAQGPEVEINGKKVLMFASNNYLGLCNHKEIVKAAKEGLKDYGFGLSSVRFICGTQDWHLELEKKLAVFLGCEDAILYSTCFMANLGFFATITNEPFGAHDYQDVIYSDEFNHASIIDAFKLVKKPNLEKRIYPHSDLKALDKMLQEDIDKGFRFKIIATDGVFSMEGEVAPLAELLALAEKYRALLFVDDAHGVGVLGETGAGSPQAEGVHGQIDVLTGTFGKALGGAVGGYIAGKKELIDLIRQKSRTYLFSNSIPPSVIKASLKALELVEQNNKKFSAKVQKNSKYFRNKIKKLGFKTLPGKHPIVPVMLGEAKVAQEMSKELLAEGLYVVGLWFPVVPEGEARLRFQVSAAHSKKHLDDALAILEKVGRAMSII